MGKLAEVKAALKAARINGRVTVRQYRGYKGLEQQGINTYYVYYSFPTDLNPLQEAVTAVGLKPAGRVIIGGAYGYRFSFQLPKGEE